jgi:hypothetical protein
VADEDGQYYILFFYGNKLWSVDMVFCEAVAEEDELICTP